MKKKFKTDKDYINFFNKADDHYYNTDTPLVSDSEYDEIKDEFERKFPNHPYLSEVGAEVKNSAFKKVKHTIPMGSLQKVNKFQELLDWYNKNGNGSQLVWSEKIDGLSISLTYKNGKLVQAVTRGNGIAGEDVTCNVLKMDVPKKIPIKAEITVRGEVVLFKNDFTNFFKDKDKVSPRNVASGLIRRLDGVGCEYLKILFYNIYSEDFIFKTQEDKFDFIENKLELRTPKWGVENNPNGIFKIWKNHEDELRESSPYEMDGLVVDLNDLSLHESLGYVSNRPKFAKAYKFTAQITNSEIESIEWQIGRTGRITPVAKITPVFLSGATISNVTLHNLAELKRLNIKIGQSVIVKRSGDVIPQIIGTNNSIGTEVSIPDLCPSCSSMLEKEEVFLKCINPKCPAQNYESLLYWVKSLEIKGFGEELVNQLIQVNKLKTPADFYKLTVEDIANLDRRGIKSAEKVLQELHSKKEILAEEFIQALGVEGIGKNTAELLLEKYPKIDQLLSISDAAVLSDIHGIGEITAQAFIDGIKMMKENINELLRHVTIKEKIIISGKFSGISFCFTGFRDKALEKTIMGLGGKISSGVSKDLNILVAANPDEHSSKTEKARKLGIQIISKEDLERRILE